MTAHQSNVAGASPAVGVTGVDEPLDELLHRRMEAVARGS